jgi:DNA-binding transcriptional LysR family regulator
MELRHLRYLVAVGEALSFTKAAERLHLAQPSLTRQIKDLEAEIGVGLHLLTNNAERQ